MARLRYLSREHVEFIAHKLAAKLFTEYGEPLPAFELFGGVRDGGHLLESAIGLPRQPYYRRLHDKAGALLRSMIKNHPLVDGNKRVGVAATFVFLAMNGQFLIASNKQLVQLALDIAMREPEMGWREIAGWLRERTLSADAPEEVMASAVMKLSGEWRSPSAIGARLDEYGEALGELESELRNELAAG